ncbi:MAG: PmbA/TldA family metallopeptidase, partial [bacterium]
MRDIAYVALNTALEYGATFCEVRVIKSRRQGINVKNGLVEELIDRVEEGIGIRVIANGAWGFAGTSFLDKDSIVETAKKAVKIALASSLTKKRNVELSPAKRIIASWSNPVRINPFEISLDKKVSLLIEATKIMTKVKDVKIAESSMDFWETEKLFINNEGTEIFQHIIESGGGISAYGIREGDMQRRSYPNSFGGQYETRGY